MNELDKAHTIAIQFNSEHSTVQLKVVQMTDMLSTDEVNAALRDGKFAGQYRASAVFHTIRGRRPVHAETVHTGRLLSKMGVLSRLDGQMRLYQLDNGANAGAD